MLTECGCPPTAGGSLRRTRTTANGTLGGWRALQFSPDGSVLYSWGDDNNLRVWDVATGQLKRAFTLNRSGTHDGDPEETRRRNPLAEINERCVGVCFRSGGNRIVLAAQNRYWIFDTATGRETASQAINTPISSVVGAETGDRLLISSAAQFRARQLPRGGWTSEPSGPARLALVALGSGSPVWSTPVNGVRSDPIAVSPDGQFVAAGIGGPVFAAIGIFDANTGSLLKTIEGADPLQGSHREAAFSPDGNRLAMAQRDGTVLIWDLVRLRVQPNP